MVQGEEPHNLSPIVVHHPVLQLLQHSPTRKHKHGECPRQEEPQNTGWQHELIAKLMGTSILKALAGTTVVKHKETLLITHRAFSKSLLNYYTPIWVAILSKTNLKELLVTQNSGIRVILVCIAAFSC